MRVHLPEQSGLYYCPAKRYEEFEYARQAISFNVTEYLLKPINLSGIRETFTRIKTELDTRGAERGKTKTAAAECGFFLAYHH